MFHIILFQPEIPPNTGNLIRLAANTGATLHLIEPLGFKVDDKSLRRAGLDYYDQACLTVHPTLAHCLNQFDFTRVFALSSKVDRIYTEPTYQKGDLFLFGPESRGLPSEMLSLFPAEQKLTIPQLTTTRSLNLSNAASIVIYEAWRQLNFKSVENNN